MSLLEGMLNEIRDGYTYPSGTATYASLFVNPPSYEFENSIAKNAQISQRNFAQQATTELLKLIEEWKKSECTFSQDAPLPSPELRISPKI
jgi:hypothetical protein